MPDSGWVKALKEAGLPFFGILTVALVSLAVILRVFPDLIQVPFPWVSGTVEICAFLCFVVVVVQLCWLAIKAPKSAPEPLASILLARRYKRLSEQQRTFLRGIYQRGRRNFEMHSVAAGRWFEELSEAGFISYVQIPIFVIGSPIPYEIPVRAWKVLQKLSHSKAL